MQHTQELEQALDKIRLMLEQTESKVDALINNLTDNTKENECIKPIRARAEGNRRE